MKIFLTQNTNLSTLVRYPTIGILPNMTMYNADTDNSRVIVVSTRFSYESQNVSAESRSNIVNGRINRITTPLP